MSSRCLFAWGMPPITPKPGASTIAYALGVSRATVYRVLAEQTAEGD